MFFCFNSLFVVRFFGSKGGAAQNGKELFLVFQELFCIFIFFGIFGSRMETLIID
jgi:hypothetical protein